MAKPLKILTVADGFGDSSAYPLWYPEYIKWPQILDLMVKNAQIDNFSRYGAGNEYIANVVRQHHRNYDLILVQWAQPNRLDLVLSHDQQQKFWENTISQDPVYKDNVVSLGDDKFWLSSQSRSTLIRDYHELYITKRQHIMRSLIFVEYVHSVLKLDKIKHGFMMSTQNPWLQQAQIPEDTWIWHEPWQGMHEFRQVSQYADLDLGIRQPIPLIHFDYIQQFIKPKFDLPWRNDREISAVESMLMKKYNQYKDKKPL